MGRPTQAVTQPRQASSHGLQSPKRYGLKRRGARTLLSSVDDPWHGRERTATGRAAAPRSASAPAIAMLWLGVAMWVTLLWLR